MTLMIISITEMCLEMSVILDWTGLDKQQLCSRSYQHPNKDMAVRFKTSILLLRRLIALSRELNNSWQFIK